MAQSKRNPIAVAFGSSLREARQGAGVSQESLALACDYDRTYVSLLERGLRQPTIGTLFQLADNLNVTAEALITATRSRLKTGRRS